MMMLEIFIVLLLISFILIVAIFAIDLTFKATEFNKGSIEKHESIHKHLFK